jgi:2-haloacid dehalogenase
MGRLFNMAAKKQAGSWHLTVPPGQVMLVAAHHDDLAGASACGLRTAYIVRPLEFGAKQVKNVLPQIGNDWHARSMMDLADQLGCA